MKSKPPIILLHGWGRARSALEYYKEVIRRLEKQGYEVFTPDMPGFGTAKIPTHPLTLADYAAFVHEIIQKKQIRHPIFIGHSFGGRVILKYASIYKNDISAIVLAGTPGFTPVKKAKLLLSLIVAKVGGFVFSLPGFSLFTERLRSWFYYTIGARDYYRAEGAMRETFKSIVSEGLISQMQSIHVPTLLLWGENDIIVPVSVAERMQQTIPNSKLTIIPNGKHSVIVDNPTDFAHHVGKFLESSL